VIDEDVDRAEFRTDRLETIADLLDVGEIRLDGKSLSRVREVGREVLDVLARPGEQRDLTALCRELSRE